MGPGYLCTRLQSNMYISCSISWGGGLRQQVMMEAVRMAVVVARQMPPSSDWPCRWHVIRGVAAYLWWILPLPPAQSIAATTLTAPHETPNTIMYYTLPRTFTRANNKTFFHRVGSLNENQKCLTGEHIKPSDMISICRYSGPALGCGGATPLPLIPPLPNNLVSDGPNNMTRVAPN